MTLKGSTAEFPLDVLIRLLGDQKKTGELTLRSPAGEGALGLAGGRVVVAVYGDEKPIPALGEIFEMGTADFEFTPWDDAPSANLEGDLDELLRKAREHRQWMTSVREVIPTDRTRFRLSERAAEQGAVTFTPDRWRVVLAVNGTRDVNDIASNLHIERDAALTVLSGLVRDGVIDTVEPPAAESGSFMSPPPAPVREAPPPQPEYVAPPEPKYVAPPPPAPEPEPEPAPPPPVAEMRAPEAAPAPQEWTMPQVQEAAPPPMPEPPPVTNDWSTPAAEPAAPAPEWSPPAPAQEVAPPPMPEPAPAMDDRLAALFGGTSATTETPPPPAPEWNAPAATDWTAPAPAAEQWTAPAPAEPEAPAPEESAAPDPRLGALTLPMAPAPAEPEAPTPPPAQSMPAQSMPVNEWAAPPAVEAPPQKKGLFGRFRGGATKEEAAPAAMPSAPGRASSRVGQLAAFSNALLTEYNSGQYGKQRLDDRMPSLLMRVDEQADPIDRPLPVLDDRLDVEALERVSLPEAQAAPYLATLVTTIYGDAEKAFGKDKAKKGYKAAQQQVFAGDPSSLAGPDLAGKLPKV